MGLFDDDVMTSGEMLKTQLLTGGVFLLIMFGLPVILGDLKVASVESVSIWVDAGLIVSLACVDKLGRRRNARLEAALKAHGIDPDNPATPESSES